MRKLNIVHIPDLHTGVRVMAPEQLYENIWLNIDNEIRKQDEIIDLLVFGGDIFDTKFPKDSTEVDVVQRIVKDASELAKMVVVIRGTEGHDRDMLAYLKHLSKYGNVYKMDITRLESQIKTKLENIKELHITGNTNSLSDDVSLLNTLLKNEVERSSDGREVYIIDTPTFMNVNGYSVLFCPEQYDVDDSRLTSYFDDRPDIVFYHGMMEGGLEHYHETKTSLIYNRSLTLSLDNLKKVQLFTVAGHIHKRVGILPYTSNEIMSTKKQKGIRAWYTGNPYQSTFIDAGLTKGFDIISVREHDHEIRFIELNGGPKFIVYNLSKIFRSADIVKINSAFVEIIRRGGHIRVDVDTSGLNEEGLIRINTMKTKYPNLKYKIYNSREDSDREESIKKTHNEIINRPLKDVILEMCEGKITEEDYEYFFGN